MYISEIENINNSLEKTNKAIVVFGCSFAAGQGAIPQDIVDNYNYEPRYTYRPILTFTDENQKKDFFKKYPLVREFADGSLDIRPLEKDNAFVNVLCKKYFKNKYTPINLGISGNGNKASVSQINFLPNIKWNLIKELIVIYMPTNPGRLGLINDDFTEVSRFVSMWPHLDEKKGPLGKLWTAYHEAIFSNKFAYLEAINDINNVINWAKNFNYKLIVYPAFTDYSKQELKNNILVEIKRDDNRKFISEGRNLPVLENNVLEEIIDNQWPWESMWKPSNSKSWIELLQNYENPKIKYTEYRDVGSPYNWITPCLHPSAKAHADLALRLCKYINRN